MRKTTKMLLAMSLAAMVFAGCNGSDDKKTDPTEAPTAPVTTEGPTAPAATDAPSATEAPAATDAPAATEAPTATVAPVATEAPKATEAPEPTPEPEKPLYGQGVKKEDAEVGKLVYFGRCEQDFNFDNGDEELRWRILDVKDGKALLLSVYAINSLDYNETQEATTWSDCSLRRYLNNDFMVNTFTDEEQAMVVKTKNTTKYNTAYNTDGGEDTEDLVFLLSVEEAQKYLAGDTQEFTSEGYLTVNYGRACMATTFAVGRGLEPYYESDYERFGSNDFDKNVTWMLRTPGVDQNHVAFVDVTGAIDFEGETVVTRITGIRPALWVTLQ